MSGVRRGMLYGRVGLYVIGQTHHCQVKPLVGMKMSVYHANNSPVNFMHLHTTISQCVMLIAHTSGVVL